MGVLIPKLLLEQIKERAHKCYPNECCGLLIGHDRGAQKHICSVRDVRNAYPGPLRNRYLISPEELLEADRSGRSAGWSVIGAYHSHPDHAAQPSRFDRESAIANFLYMILSVRDGVAGELKCWTLAAENETFSCEELVVSVSDENL
jgi:proteasome lid subunit RPN8/RPN11